MERRFKNEIIVCKKIFLEKQSTFALDSLKIEKKKKEKKMKNANKRKKDEQRIRVIPFHILIIQELDKFKNLNIARFLLITEKMKIVSLIPRFLFFFF